MQVEIRAHVEPSTAAERKTADEIAEIAAVVRGLQDGPEHPAWDALTAEMDRLVDLLVAFSPLQSLRDRTLQIAMETVMADGDVWAAIAQVLTEQLPTV